MPAGPLNYRTFEGQCYEEEKLGVLCFSLLNGVSGLFFPTFQETDTYLLYWKEMGLVLPKINENTTAKIKQTERQIDIVQEVKATQNKQTF